MNIEHLQILFRTWINMGLCILFWYLVKIDMKNTPNMYNWSQCRIFTAYYFMFIGSKDQFFFKYSCVTQLGTLNWTGSKKSCRFGLYKKHEYSILFENYFDIWVQCSNERLLIRHTTILDIKKYYRRSQTLKSEIRDKYTTQKKNHLTKLLI